jgi:uncharacterized protein (TIGR03437 family)
MFVTPLKHSSHSLIVVRLVLIGLVLPALLWYGDNQSRAGAQQTVGKVTSVSAASFEPNGIVAPDSIVAAFGANLATITQVANTLPLPTIISNVTVEVNGRSAAMLFISPNQINYLLPEDLAEGTGQVLVKRNGQIVAAGEIEIRAGAPSIFMANPDTQGPPAANLLRVRADNSQVLESASQFDGTKGRFISRVIDLDAPNELVFLILYLTGTSKEPQAGDYRILLGGSECRPEFMTYIGVAPGFAGLKQINLNLGGCVQKLRQENARANFTGKVSVALADIKNGQASNIFELEFAPPTGAPPRVTGLNKATLLAGEVLEIQGNGLAETSEIYLTDSSGNRFNAQIERPVTPTTVRVRVPFGAGTGTITAVTGRGNSTFPLTMRTSVSGVVQLVQRQPDGTDRRIGVRNATLLIISPNLSAAVLSGDDGSFLIPDVVVPNTAQGTPIYLNVDGSTAGIANLSLKRVDRLIAFAGRDNQFPGYLELRPSTGPSIPVGSNGLLPDEAIRMRASARPEENEYTGQTGEVVFEPNGSAVRFADGSTVNALTVTALDPGRVPVDLPAGQFSSTIVQMTPIGGSIQPGGKLTFPNSDQLPAGTEATLYRYDQTPGSATFGVFVPTGKALVSADGLRVETGAQAVIESTYYLVSVSRPTTVIHGSVAEADGQPARAAQVQVRGQSGLALTDVNGGFLLRNVPVVGVESVIEVNYLRADGTVDRAERRGVMLRVGTTLISPPIVLPGQGQGRAPVLLLPKSLAIEAGKTTDYTFLAYARLATATLQPLTVTGASFATVTSLNNDRYMLRLTPGAGAAGNYTLAVAATDNQGMRTDETIALEVKTPAVNLPVAVGQSVTTDEDQPVGITLSGSGGTQYRIVNAPQRGGLSGTLPNLIYTPNRDFNGSDNFSFVVGNGSVESAPATVTIAVRPVNDAPRLEVETSYRTNIGQLLRVVINGSDHDAEQTLMLTNTQLPAGARIDRVTGTSWLMEWTPTNEQNGVYSFNLMLSDNGKPPLNDSKTITVSVDATWAQTSGPEGGNIEAFALKDRAFFVGTTGGVYRTTDDGVTWTLVNNGLNRAVQALGVSGTALFAGTDRGVYRTTDNGNTWAPVNKGLGDPSVRAFAVNGSMLFAGAGFGSGVYRTTDNGANWTPVNNGLTITSVRSLAASGAALFAGTIGGIFRTTDGGNNWTAVNNGLPNSGNVLVHTLAVSGTTLFAGMNSEVYRTTDNGANWVPVNNGLNNNGVGALGVSGMTLYAWTIGGVYRTTDNGANWVPVSNGLNNISVKVLGGSGTALFAGTFNKGLYRTTDNGANWVPVNNGLIGSAVKTLAVNGMALFAGTTDGLYRTTDSGNNWVAVNNGIPGNVTVNALGVSGTTVFAGTSFGLYLTLNNGDLWLKLVNNGLPSNVIINALRVSGTTVFAGTQGQGVYRTVDNGVNWTQVNNGLNNIDVRAFAVSGTMLFAGSFGGGVYRTTNNGANWTQVNKGLTNTIVYALAVNGTALFAGTFGGAVYRTLDNGENWAPVYNGLTSESSIVNALTVSGTALFAGTFGGVYRTTDNGNSWMPVNSGLNYISVQAIAVAGETLFAGTSSSGVFILAEAELVWSESNAGLGSKQINTAIVSGSQTIVGTFGGGVYRSGNRGDNWAPSNSGLPPSADVKAFSRHNSTLFAGLNGEGVFVSVDDGGSWAARANGLGNQQVNALTSDGLRLVAGTEGGVYRSIDSGANWSLANNGITRQKILSLLATPSGLYAGTDLGLFRSTNGGASWTPINTGLTDLYIVSLGVAPNGTTIFAGTTSGVYRSTNNGSNWSKLTSGLPDRVTALTFTTTGTKLLAGTVYGFYISEDNGANWRGINTGLLNLQVSGIAVQGNRVIVGTRSAGVFVSQLQ